MHKGTHSRMSEMRDQSKKISSTNQNIIKCSRTYSDYLGVLGYLLHDEDTQSKCGSASSPRAPPPQTRQHSEFSSVACLPNRQVLYNPTGRNATIVLSKLAGNNTQDVHNCPHDLLQPCASLSVCSLTSKTTNHSVSQARQSHSRALLSLSPTSRLTPVLVNSPSSVPVGVVLICLPFLRITGLPLFPNAPPCLQFCSCPIHSPH